MSANKHEVKDTQITSMQTTLFFFIISPFRPFSFDYVRSERKIKTEKARKHKKTRERFYIGQNKITTTKCFGVDDSFMFLFSV